MMNISVKWKAQTVFFDISFDINLVGQCEKMSDSMRWRRALVSL
jgi:hypothetical protein